MFINRQPLWSFQITKWWVPLLRECIAPGAIPSSHVFCLLCSNLWCIGDIVDVLWANRGHLPISERVYSYRFVYLIWSTSPMHCIIKAHRQKVMDDGVAPSGLEFHHFYGLDNGNSLIVKTLRGNGMVAMFHKHGKHVSWHFNSMFWWFHVL